MGGGSHPTAPRPVLALMPSGMGQCLFAVGTFYDNVLYLLNNNA